MSFDQLFSEARAQKRAALLPYLMTGVPDVGASVSLFEAMADAGADGFEIGIPYADPLMDGPVIQEAGKRALENGMTLERGIAIAGEVVSRTSKPSVIMTYVNPVLRAGVGRFASMVSDAGLSGVIIADLPVDEAAPFQQEIESAGLGLVLFAAPTTSDERLLRVVKANPMFVYGVAEMGVTGERDQSSSRAGALAARVRGITTTPLVLGVGISGPAAARDAAPLADGIIVGSALVRRVIDSKDVAAAEKSLAEAVTDLVSAVRWGDA